MKLNKDYTGEITLGSSHSVILGNKPDILTYKHICDKIANERKSMMNFGLFDTAAPNYSTYYPELNIEDLTPKEGEFIYPVFRALSKTIVSKYFPIDFSKGSILKNSMSKLIGQTVNIDHETMIGNAIGSVKDAFWQNEYKTADGITVPAGINIVMMIDGKSNPRIARGIMMDPPSIHSNSVGIRFKWEPSHEFEDKSEFWQKAGSFDKDGELIRAVVTEVVAFVETSLVAHGADVFAQKIGEDGKIVNPNYSASVYQFSQENNNVKGLIHMDFKQPETFDQEVFNNTIPDKLNTSDTSGDETKNNNNNVNMKITKEELQELSTKFGFAEGELTEDNYLEKVAGKFNDLSTEHQELLDSREAEDGETLSAEELTNLRDLEKVANTALSDIRKEAIRLYKLAVGKDNEDNNIITVIQAADYKTAQSFFTQYNKEAQSKFSATCTCGKTVKLGSAIGSEENLIDEDGNPINTDNGEGKGAKSLTETREYFRNKRNPSRLFKDKK